MLVSDTLEVGNDVIKLYGSTWETILYKGVAIQDKHRS